MVEKSGQAGQPAPAWDLKELRKASSENKCIAGICAGLGEHTPLPAWLYRAAFLTLLFAGGIGLIAYIMLWLFMPPAKSA